MEYKQIDSDLTTGQRSMIEELRSAIQSENLIKEDDPNALGTDDLTLLYVSVHAFIPLYSFAIQCGLSAHIAMLNQR
jgi:hypothetical protein